jgi:hypothetical protein
MAPQPAGSPGLLTPILHRHGTGAFLTGPVGRGRGPGWVRTDSIRACARPRRRGSRQRSRHGRRRSAAELVETLYRGLADNSVGRVIDTLLRNDVVLVDEVGFAPLDATGTQLLFRFVAAAYERRSLGIASHWAFNDWGRFLPEHTTATSLLDRLLHHAVVIVTDGDSYRMRTRGGGPTT